MSTPTTDLREEMGRRGKNGINPQTHFTWFQILPKTWSKDMIVIGSTFSTWVAYTLGKTVSLMCFALQIFLVTVSFFILNFGSLCSHYFLLIFRTF